MGFKNTGDEWELFFSHSVPPTRDIGAFYFKETNNIGLLYKTFRGSYKLIEIGGTKIVNETKYGSDLFYPGKIFYITYSRYALSIILPFILAVILTRLMRKHRVCIHSSDYTTMAYASLTKRALSMTGTVRRRRSS